MQGVDVNDIYETVVDTAKTYESTKTALTQNFQPKKNLTFEIYNFRKLKQDDEGKKNELNEENIAHYLARLKEAGLRCEFHDLDRELKHQIVFNCKSDAVRRKALRDDPELEVLLKYARSVEISESQTKVMDGDSSSDVSKIRRFPGRYSSKYQKKRRTHDNMDSRSKYRRSGYQNEGDKTGGNVRDKSCFNCGNKWPHPGEYSNCPAKGMRCRNCGKQNRFSAVCPALVESDRCKINVEQIENRESSNDSSDDNYCYQVDKASINKIETGIKLKIKNRTIKMKIDTGTDENIIDQLSYEKLKDYVKLKKTGISLRGYNSKMPLNVLGKFSEIVETKSKLMLAEFYVYRKKVVHFFAPKPPNSYS